MMYIFPYADIGDTGKIEQKFGTKEMLSIEYQDDSAKKEGYNFRVELESKVFFFNSSTAHECRKWVEV